VSDKLEPSLDEIEEMVSTSREAFALVGEFFCHWGWLEQAIDRSIGNMLGADLLATFILSQNITFSAKIDVLASAGNMFGEQESDAENKKFQKALERIGELSRSQRNVYAHSPFLPLKNGGVKFLRLRAKKALKFAIVELSRKELRTLAREIHGLIKVVEEFSAAVAAKRATGAVP
jgi:hypothetical protein